MKLAFSVEGKDLDANIDLRFGRCKWFTIADSGSMSCEVFENPAVTSTQGAGVQSAQFIADKGAEAVITGHVGPNAYQILDAAGIQIYDATGLTVREAIESFNKGVLVKISEAGQAHAGLRHRHGRS